MVALTAALADLVYAQRTLTENACARAALADDLRGLGLHVGPSAANFLLVRLPAGSPCAAELVERLILDHGIVVRDCSSYEGLAEAGTSASASASAWTIFASSGRFRPLWVAAAHAHSESGPTPAVRRFGRHGRAETRAPAHEVEARVGPRGFLYR